MREIIAKAEALALSEIAAHGSPLLELFLSSNEHGQRIAHALGADKEIVMAGTLLMDVKLGECSKEGKLPEHIARGAEETRAFLLKFSLDEERKEKIVNCVEGHHATVPWTCLEAEVCANADCYRFLSAGNWLLYLHSLAHREGTFAQHLAQAEAKADEKWRILSLQLCKDELEGDYRLIKELCAKARGTQSH